MDLRLSLRTHVRRGVLLSGFFIWHAADAADEPAGTAKVDKLDRIEVTGSNIRRTDSETPSPVQVITAEDLKKSGYTSVSDVLRNITANGQGTLSQAFSQAFASGGSGIALRGLTVGATLVLINGHRTTAYPLSDDGQRSFVDISAIPFDTVERIEVLKDGASAVYGSDAIAGVVNVILKRQFVGTRATVDLGTSYQGDGGSQHIAITHGAGDLAADGHTGYVSLEYRHQSPILLVNRSAQFTNRDYRGFGGVDATPGVANAVNGGLPGSDITHYLPGTLTGYTVDRTTGATTLLPGCSPTSPNYNYTGFCSNYNRNLLIQPDTHNLNLLGKYTQALDNNWEASLDASAFSSSAEQVVYYQSTNFAQGGIYGIAAGAGIQPGLYPATGPLLITAPNDPNQALVYNFPSLGPAHTTVDTQTYRLIGDLKGALAGWNVDASLGATRAFTHSKFGGVLSIPGVQSIIAANPGVSAAQLVSQFASPQNASVLAPLAYATSSSELDFVTLRGDRELVQLPGGPLQLGLGGELTYHKLDTVAPASVAQGYQYANDSFAIGSQTVTSAYFELDAPVLKMLELDLAGRTDRYNSYGSSTTPKAGFKLTPIKEATLRGTYSRGFRAPNTAESGTAGQAFLFGSTPDLLLCPGGGAASTDIKSQCNLNPTYFQKSNAQLSPEKSTSYTLGVILEPVPDYSLTVDYYKIKVTNQITSAINLESTNVLQANAIRGPAGQLLQTVGGQLVPISVGTIQYIPVPYLNANSTETNGVELNLLGKFNLAEYGRLTANLDVTHIFRYSLNVGGTVYELAGTHGPSGISGDTGTPQTRAQLTVTWDQGPLELATTANYISHYDVTDPASGLPTCAAALSSAFNGPFAGGTPIGQISPTACYVASFTTFDLYGRYALDKHWSFHGSVMNALNRIAPLDLQTYGGSNYNPSLHQAGAVGRYFTVGAVYDF